MNRWREIQYVDDGCTAYQCLQCKESFTSRTECGGDHGYKFCPFCGTKWEGEHLWQDKIEYFPFVELPLEAQWVMFSRSRFANSDDAWTDWTVESTYSFNYSAFVVLDRFRRDKALNGLTNSRIWEIEFKIVLLSPNHPDYIPITFGRVGRSHSLPFTYWKQYQVRWGGKLHYPERMRHWYRRH